MSTQDQDSKAPWALNRPQLKTRFRGFLPVVVDVETAGFNPRTDALLEVAMMTVTMDEQGFLSPGKLMSANLRPFEGSVVNEENVRFLGIDPYDETRDLKDEQEYLPEFFKAVRAEVRAQGCKKALLVGQNGNFDLGFIAEAAKRVGWEKKNPFHPFTVLDTASLSALVYGHTVLARSCMAAGLEFDASSAHGAAYDTRMECRLFCAAVNRFTRFCGLPEPLE